MLSVAEAVRQRRSTRSFQRIPVPGAMILEMLEAARLAPSGSNAQPWRFVVVTDPAEKAELRRLCFGQAFVEEAGVDFVICADLSAYSKEAHLKRRQEAVDAGLVAAGAIDEEDYQRYLDAIDSDRARQITPATANTYIAAEHLVLMATALGLGSCWVGGISDHKAVRDMLAIPRGILVLGIVAVGYAQDEAKARPRLPLEDILLRPLPSEPGPVGPGVSETPRTASPVDTIDNLVLGGMIVGGGIMAVGWILTILWAGPVAIYVWGVGAVMGALAVATKFVRHYLRRRRA